MKKLTRKEISNLILERITKEKKEVSQLYSQTQSTIGYFYIDNILPKEIAKACFDSFPDVSNMKCLKSIREYKYVSAQMNMHSRLLEEVLYAFQDNRIVKLIGEICNIEALHADESLYAGGVSLMKKNNFLHPHLDNSHDAERERWRVLNLLFYVTPNWEKENGGHLELWPNGTKKEPVLIQSKFNRLVVMATHHASWHSVNKVVTDKSRCCISNYYFSDIPLREKDKFHVTQYRGRPEHAYTNVVLNIDAKVRMLLRKFFKKGIRKNPHMYDK